MNKYIIIYIYFLFAFQSFLVYGQNDVYYLDKKGGGLFIVDTIKLRFEYHSLSFDNQSCFCEGRMHKIQKNEYILNSDYDVDNLPLKIKEMDCKSQLSKEKTFYFDFGKDSSVLESIKGSKIKIDSASIKKNMPVFDESTFAKIYKYDLKHFPAIWLQINDTIHIPLFNDTISYLGNIYNILLYSNMFHINSKKYNINNKCSVFKVSFNIQDRFQFYCRLNKFALHFNEDNTIIIKSLNYNFMYNFKRVSKIEGEKYNY
jgi:hypothetical protein